MRLIVVAAALSLASPLAAAADRLPPDLARRVEQLSRSLTTQGAGWTQYESILHPNYARWVVGDAYQDRAAFIAGLKEWWDHGMRVKSREDKHVAADITDDIAVIRMTTTETFAGPDGVAGGYKGHVVNIWVKEDGEWMLLSADIVDAAP